MSRLLLYIGALLASLMAVTGLMVLPPAGLQSMENLFSLAWLSFALLVTGAFLRDLHRKEKLSSPGRRKNRGGVTGAVIQGRSPARKKRAKRVRGES